MTDSPYWNPKNETMPREELRQLQLLKLKRICEWAYAHAPFHRRRFEAAGVHPDQINSLDDLRRLPMMTRDEWVACQNEKPLWSDLIAAEPRNAIRYHLTSGSTGRQPLRALDSTKDWEWISEMWCYGAWGFGVRPDDVVYFAFGYGSFIGFWGAHYGCEKIGALVIPGGAQTTERRIEQIVELGVTTVFSTPTYALRLWQEAVAMGVDLAATKVDKVIVSGEPAGSIPAMKRQLEHGWGAACGDTAGMTEIGTIFAFECAEQPGGPLDADVVQLLELEVQVVDHLPHTSQRLAHTARRAWRKIGLGGQVLEIAIGGQQPLFLSTQSIAEQIGFLHFDFPIG